MRDRFFHFWRDRSGSYLVMAALLLPVFIGFAGLATEEGLWLYSHQTILSAADSAAVSAATAGGDFFAQASAVTASYGFVDGADDVIVTVNQPPQSGNYKSTPGAVEVVVQQEKARLFSSLFSSEPLIVEARAVALGNVATGCVLALDRNADAALNVKGSARVNLQGCGPYVNSTSGAALSVSGSATVSALSVSVVGGVSGNGNIVATNGIKTGVAPTADPYAGVSPSAFSGCDRHNFSAKSTTTINPGVYCGGMTFNAGADVTLNPGVYYLDQGSLSITGGATISGAGVTLVFTSSTGNNWATANVASNATVDLTAPTSGPTAGIAIFGDRNMPVGTSFSFEGGATQTFGGAIYLPEAAVKFAGGSSAGSGCIQLIADTIEFVGNSDFQIDCRNSGTNPIGRVTATLVE